MLSNVASKVIRSVGRSLDRVGAALEVNPNFDIATPCLRSTKFKSATPAINNTFVAPTAAVIGKVTLGERSSVWNSAIIRGDVNTISIGNDTSVGDRVMIHCSAHGGNYPTVIGNKVILGAGSLIHGCTIEDGAFIGEGSQVMDGAVVQAGAVVSPGSIVTSKKVVPAGQLWAGVPAKFVRNVTPKEAATFERTIAENQELAVIFAEEFAKDAETVKSEEDLFIDYRIEFPRKVETAPVEEDALPTEEGIYGHDVPGRLLDSKLSAYNHVDPIIKDRYTRGTTY